MFACNRFVGCAHKVGDKTYGARRTTLRVMCDPAAKAKLSEGADGTEARLLFEDMPNIDIVPIYCHISFLKLQYFPPGAELMVYMLEGDGKMAVFPTRRRVDGLHARGRYSMGVMEGDGKMGALGGNMTPILYSNTIFEPIDDAGGRGGHAFNGKREELGRERQRHLPLLHGSYLPSRLPFRGSRVPRRRHVKHTCRHLNLFSLFKIAPKSRVVMYFAPSTILERIGPCK